MSVLVLYCCVTNYHKSRGLRQHVYYLTVWSLAWLSWVLCSGSHQAVIRVAAGLHWNLQRLQRWRINFQDHSELISFWLYDWGLRFLAGSKPGATLSYQRWPTVPTIPHCVALSKFPLATRQLTSCKPAVDRWISLVCASRMEPYVYNCTSNLICTFALTF